MYMYMYMYMYIYMYIYSICTHAGTHIIYKYTYTDGFGRRDEALSSLSMRP
jgi:hypothetical protein